MTTRRDAIQQFKYVRILKKAEVDAPEQKSGDWNSHQFGVMNLGVSLPINYWIEGWLVDLPKVGEPVHVLRHSRNGVATPGIFKSSPVTALLGSGEFHTANSKYSWIELDPETTDTRQAETNIPPQIPPRIPDEVKTVTTDGGGHVGDAGDAGADLSSMK